MHDPDDVVEVIVDQHEATEAGLDRQVAQVSADLVDRQSDDCGAWGQRLGHNLVTKAEGAREQLDLCRLHAALDT